MAASTLTSQYTIDGLQNTPYRDHLTSELAFADDPQANWESERFQERAKAQLQQLVITACGSSDVEATDALTELQRQDVDVDLLSPSTKRIHLNGAVEVRRWAAHDTPPNATSSSALGDSLRQLLAGMPGGSRPRIELKIVEVQLLERDDATTRVLVEVLVNDQSTQHSRNQTWNCHWSEIDTELPRLTRLNLLESEDTVCAAGALRFEDETQQIVGHTDSFAQQLNVDLDDWRRRIDWRFGIDVVGSHGLAVGDVNGDGLDDLFVCEAGGLPNRLYVQQADGTARDVSHEAGVDYLEPTHSALLLDLDNDGDQDLIVAAGRYVLWFANDGSGVFTRVGLHESNSMIRSMAAADVDGNGFIDVYVCGYFSRDSSGDSVGLGRPLPYHDANNGAPNYLLANQGHMQFRDVTTEVGLDQNNRRFSYAGVWADYDNDGDMDLYVANDFGRNNLYRNDKGRFTDIAAEAGVEDISAGMSVSWGDYDRDGRLDLYVGNMYSSAGNRVSYQREFLPGASDASRHEFQRHARGNSLYRNLGGDRFEDQSIAAGVNMGRWAWSSPFVDLNNDGWEDLFVANGMVTARQDPGDL